MTPALIQILQPIETAFVSFCAAGILAAAGAITYWAQGHFAIANTAAAKSIEANANSVLQAALANGAGDVIAEINSGAIDFTDAKGLRAAAMIAAGAAADRVPEAVALLQPAAGQLTEMLTQKVHLAMAPAVVVATRPSSAPPVKPRLSGEK